ncbi:transposase IS3/IS911 family protein [Mycobacterium kansasii 662]|nr:transposase IS3/IS911 family protein [Mycobacterium sp. MAC_011194_8550]EUA21711.1 transposase IS3/IS911 family protein [Mycobacterium kansasii 662]
MMVAQPVAEIGRELNVHEHLLRKWVAAERLRDGAATDAHRVPPDGG